MQRTQGASRSSSRMAPRRRMRSPTMASWLKDGYRVSIPHDAISDCNWHRLAVTVRGESTSVTFSRCDTIPEQFRFRNRLDVPAGKACQVKSRHHHRHRYRGAHPRVWRRLLDRVRYEVYERAGKDSSGRVSLCTACHRSRAAEARGRYAPDRRRAVGLVYHDHGVLARQHILAQRLTVRALSPLAGALNGQAADKSLTCATGCAAPPGRAHTPDRIAPNHGSMTASS